MIATTAGNPFQSAVAAGIAGFAGLRPLQAADAEVDVIIRGPPCTRALASRPVITDHWARRGAPLATRITARKYRVSPTRKGVGPTTRRESPWAHHHPSGRPSPPHP